MQMKSGSGLQVGAAKSGKTNQQTFKKPFIHLQIESSDSAAAVMRTQTPMTMTIDAKN